MRVSNLQYKQEWERYIKKFAPFDWYVALTFKGEIHPELAKKRLEYFIGLINKDLYGVSYDEAINGIYYIASSGKQKRGVTHFHLLIGGGVSGLNKDFYNSLWRQFNGFASIKNYDSSQNGIGYLVSHTNKYTDSIEMYVPEWKRREVLEGLPVSNR